MAKFFDVVGYGETEETSPGVWVDRIIEREYYGDILHNVRRLEESEFLNKNISARNRISILADAYANEHFFAIRYVRWAGTLWTVANVEVQSPRLVLWLGGVYNGPTIATPVSSRDVVG